MSSSSMQMSDFKRQVQERTQVPAWGKAPKGKPAPPPSQAGPSAAPIVPPPESLALPNGKKKKYKSDVVWSQPTDTGTGTQRGTQLALALDYLKKSPNPVRLEDLAHYSGVLTLLSDSVLLTAFESDPGVTKNAINGLYEWKRVYHARTPEQLAHEIRTKGRDGGGLSVKQLAEGFPEVATHVLELEKKGQVLVTRGTKDNAPKYVFWNELTVEQGGKPVEEEFRSLWHSLNNPAEPDLLRSLERDGLQATNSEVLPVKQLPKKKSKKGKSTNRVGKITNTHIAGVDLTKDFVKPT